MQTKKTLTMVNMTFDEIIAKLDKLDELSDKIAERIPKSLDDEEHPKDIYTATAIKFILLYLKRYDCLYALMDVLKSDAFSTYYKYGYSRFHMDNSYIGFDKKKTEVEVNNFRKVYASKIHENEHSKTILQFLEKFLIAFCRDYFPVVDYVMHDYTSDTVHDNPNVDEHIKQWESSCFNGLLRSMIDVINMIPEKSYLQYYPQIVDYFAPHSHVYENYDLLFHNLKLKEGEFVAIDLPSDENKIAQVLGCHQLLFLPDGGSFKNVIAISAEEIASRFSGKEVLFYERLQYKQKQSSIIQYIIFDAFCSISNDGYFIAPSFNNEYADIEEAIDSCGKKTDLFIQWGSNYNYEYLLSNRIDPQTGRFISIDFSIGLNDFLFHDKEIQHIKNGIIEKIIVFADCTILFYNLAKTKDSMCFVKANHLFFKDSDSIRPNYNRQQKDLLLSEIKNNANAPHIREIPFEELAHNRFETIYNRYFKLNGTNVSGIVRTVFNRHLLDNDFSDIFSELIYSIAKYARFGFDLESKFPIVFENGEEEVLLDNIPQTIHALLSLYRDSISSGNIIMPDELANFGLRLLGKEREKVIYNPFAGYGEFIPESKEFVYIGIEKDNLLSTIDELKIEYSNNGGRIREKEIKGKKYDRIISFPPLRRGSEMESMTAYAESIQQVCHTFDSSSDNAKAVLFLSADFLYCKPYENILHHIIDNRWLDTIIYLPDSIYGKEKLRTLVLILNKTSKWRIDEFDLTSFVSQDNKFRIEDAFDTIESAQYNGEGRYFDTIEYEQLTNQYQFAYPSEIFPYGGESYSLSQILQPIKGERTPDLRGLLFESKMSYDYLDCIKDSKQYSMGELSSKHRKFTSDVFILPDDTSRFQPILCKATNEDPIFIDCDRYYTYTINMSMVDPMYLTWVLCHPYSKNQLYMRCHLSTIIKKEDVDTVLVKVSSPEEQRECVECAQKKILEDKIKEMDDRLIEAVNLRENDFRSIRHSLGAPMMEIHAIIRLLKDCCQKNNYLNTIVSQRSGYTIENCIKKLKERVDYISVLFSEGEIKNLEEYALSAIDIESVIRYLDFETGTYSIKKGRTLSSGDPNLKKKVTVNLVLLQICIGNIFVNAEKHAFSYEKKTSNIVEIDEFVETDKFIIRIKNNGKPFPEGFTHADFILRGRKAGQNAGDGIGGYDISRIMQYFNAKFQLYTAFSELFPTCYELIFNIL